MSSTRNDIEPMRPVGTNHDLLYQVTDAASRLAGEVSGPLRKVSIRLETAAVDLEWGDDGAGHTEPERPLPDSVDDDRITVRSPMVGTFYHAPAPGEAPFVSTGSEVGTDTVVGIVEAMKLMNQITAENRGIVRDVLVANGEAVEFDQPLLVLDPIGYGGDGQ